MKQFEKINLIHKHSFAKVGHLNFMQKFVGNFFHTHDSRNTAHQYEGEHVLLNKEL